MMKGYIRVILMNMANQNELGQSHHGLKENEKPHILCCEGPQ